MCIPENALDIRVSKRVLWDVCVTASEGDGTPLSPPPTSVDGGGDGDTDDIAGAVHDAHVALSKRAAKLMDITGESEVQRLSIFLQNVILNPDTPEGKARIRFLTSEVQSLSAYTVHNCACRARPRVRARVYGLCGVACLPAAFTTGTSEHTARKRWPADTAEEPRANRQLAH